MHLVAAVWYLGLCRVMLRGLEMGHWPEGWPLAAVMTACGVIPALRFLAARFRWRRALHVTLSVV